MEIKYVTGSAISGMMQLGWIDPAGRELTWKYWQRQRKRFPFIWVEDEPETEEEVKLARMHRSKPRNAPLGRD